ncbi:hypothetical protein ACP70R_047287 [Stipagrostis hirtigluma subsp. patula]
MYGPSDKELRDIIQDENSFTINKMQVQELIDSMDKGSITPKMMALTTRAVFEPVMMQHFGQVEAVEEFVRSMEWHLNAGTPQVSAPGVVSLCVSLTKKI